MRPQYELRRDGVLFFTWALPAGRGSPVCDVAYPSSCRIQCESLARPEGRPKDSWSGLLDSIAFSKLELALPTVLVVYMLKRSRPV